MIQENKTILKNKENSKKRIIFLLVDQTDLDSNMWKKTLFLRKIDYKKITSFILRPINSCIGFLVGCAFGAYLFSENMVIKKGDFIYTTDKQDYVIELLERYYKSDVKILKEKSKKYDEEFNRSKEENKKEILKEVIHWYLSPTFYDSFYGRDIVVFNEKGKPIYLVLDEFREIEKHWISILKHSGKLECVEYYKKNINSNEIDHRLFLEVCKNCLEEH